MDAELEKEVRDVIGGNFEKEELEEGLNTIYRLDTGNDEYILKIHTNKEEGFSESYRMDQKARFRAEARIYQLVSENTGVPSPEIIYTDFSEENVPQQFYIMEKMDGQNLDRIKEGLNSEELADIIEEYGRLLAQIHRGVELDSYGLLIEENGGFGYLEQGDTWGEAFTTFMQNLSDIIEQRWEQPPGIKLEHLEEQISDLPGKPEPVLVHSDNRLENVLVQKGSISGFLDWSFTRAGHAMYDLARAEYLLIDYDLALSGREEKELEGLREQLLEGYREIRSTEDYSRFRGVYRYATVLWIMAGFPNWSSDWSEERRESFRQELLERFEKEKPV